MVHGESERGKKVSSPRNAVGLLQYYQALVQRFQGSSPGSISGALTFLVDPLLVWSGTRLEMSCSSCCLTSPHLNRESQGFG